MAADPLVTLAKWRNLLQTDGAWVAAEQADLWAAFAELDRGPREAMLLSLLDGRSVGDIANILDESNGTVAFWISSARRRLETATPNVREGLLALAAAAPTSAAPPRRRRSAIVRLGVPAAVGVVALIVGAMQLTAKPPAGNGAGAAPPSGPTVSSLQWTSVQFEKGAFVTDLVAAEDQLVAIGSNSDGAATTWVSSDEGDSWRRLDLPLSPPVKGAHANLTHAAAGDRAIVTTGEWEMPNQAASQPSWASWSFSGSRRPEWQEGPGTHSGFIFDLAATPRGFVAVGVDFGRGTLQAWGSSDGLQWANMRTRGLPEFGAIGLNLAVFKDQLIAAGVNQEGSRPRIGIWTMADGNAWVAAPGAPVDQGAINDISPGMDRILAVGATWSSPTTNEDSVAMLWSSPNGTTWKPLVLTETPGSQAVAVADGPLGAVISTISEIDGSQTWFLPLGASEPIPQPEVEPFLTRAIALPDRFVAIGSCPDRASCSQSVLIGRAASAPPVSSP